MIFTEGKTEGKTTFQWLSADTGFVSSLYFTLVAPTAFLFEFVFKLDTNCGQVTGHELLTCSV